jgi:hypothetical protein
MKKSASHEFNSLSSQIETYFDAFSKGDYRTMRSLCDPKITFNDPVYTSLQGKSVFALHHFMAERRICPTITIRSISEKGNRVKVKWTNEYEYATYKTHISIDVRSIFHFEHTSIISQTDQYNLWKWSKMALGFTGTYLGWTPMFRSTLRRSSQQSLATFIQKHPQYK